MIGKIFQQKLAAKIFQFILKPFLTFEHKDSN